MYITGQCPGNWQYTIYHFLGFICAAFNYSIVYSLQWVNNEFCMNVEQNSYIIIPYCWYGFQITLILKCVKTAEQNRLHVFI